MREIGSMIARVQSSTSKKEKSKKGIKYPRAGGSYSFRRPGGEQSKDNKEMPTRTSNS